jgi:8-oxo-dGTP diphosphatase
MSTDSRHSVSVAGVIVDDEGRALLVQRRDNGHWEPPGGVLEHGETIEEALRREVLEETGLEIEPGPLTGVYQNMTRHIVALVFRCSAVGGQLVENDEVRAFRWASASDCRPVVRAHDGTHLLLS